MPDGCGNVAAIRLEHTSDSFAEENATKGDRRRSKST